MEFAIHPLWVAGAVVVYFLPTIVAFLLGHVEWKGILFINFLFGWTIIIWLALFIWVADTKKTN